MTESRTVCVNTTQKNEIKDLAWMINLLTKGWRKKITCTLSKKSTENFYDFQVWLGRPRHLKIKADIVTAKNPSKTKLIAVIVGENREDLIKACEYFITGRTYKEKAGLSIWSG